MSWIGSIKGFAVDKAFDAFVGYIEYTDNSDDLRDIYTEQTKRRVSGSFLREDDILHADITEDSEISEFLEEIEDRTVGEGFIRGELAVESDRYIEAEGFGEGLYQIFDESDAAGIVIHSDDKDYLAPSTGGTAAFKVIASMQFEQNMSREVGSSARKYITNQLLSEREEKELENYRKARQRPGPL